MAISAFARVRSSILSSGGGSAVRIGSPSRWRLAVQEHRSRPLVASVPKTAIFEGFGRLHLVLAEHLFDYCIDLPKQHQNRIVHVDIEQDLLSACCLYTQRVQLRQQALVQHATNMHPDLRCRLMPASARLIDDLAGQELLEISLSSLMWHWGQFAPSAAEHVPDFGEQVLSVKGFPSLPPQILQLRQLKLIHQLGKNPMPFELLEQHTPEPDRLYLCADLTCLYTTGVLQVRTM